eukprot:scaffold25770_cov147-Cylindrotheca_fusiformis.AAC.1
MIQQQQYQKEELVELVGGGFGSEEAASIDIICHFQNDFSATSYRKGVKGAAVFGAGVAGAGVAAGAAVLVAAFFDVLVVVPFL